MHHDAKTIDQRKRRCPRLGHTITFSYCRIGGDNQDPCFKVFDCWWEHFDVVAYFQRQLSADAFKKLRSASPPNKVTTLVDLIQQARNRIQNKL